MTTTATRGRFASGLLFALISALAFGSSGTLATGLITAGWTPLAAVTVRVWVGALVLAWPAIRALRGQWSLLRTNLKLIIAYGLLGVSGAQLCYFQAVERLPVATALLIEYMSPLVVVLFWWLVRGQRPTPIVSAGALFAVGGLVLVLDVTGVGTIDPIGVLWSFGATIGAAGYFLISADDRSGLPPITLAWAGLVIGGLIMGSVGVLGVLPFAGSTTATVFAGVDVPWWVSMMALGLVTAAVAYVTGIEAARRLGSRVASFVALSEVLIAAAIAALLVGQVPGIGPAVGSLLVITGIVLVKIGEPHDAKACCESQPSTAGLSGPGSDDYK